MDALDPNERLRALFSKGEQVDIDYGVPVRRYFRSCQELIRMAGVYYEEKNFENSYILYAKFIVLSFEKLKNHPDYANVPAGERQANKKALKIAFDRAEKLKPVLKKTYQEEYTKHLEEQAMMVARRREAEVRRREEHARLMEEEARRLEEIEEKKRKADQAMLDAFLLAQEQKKLEKERQAIEAEFGEKLKLNESRSIEDELLSDVEQNHDTTTSSSSLLLPHDIAPPPYIPPPQPLKPATPAIPSRITKPSIQTTFPSQPQQAPVPSAPPPPPASVPTSSSMPAVDRSLKPTSDFNSAAFGASLTRSKNKYGLRTIVCPAALPQQFLKIAESNTRRSIETCGVLFGKLANEVFVLTHVLVPHQKGAPDSCDTTREEDMWDFQDRYNGICLGWIHTHPSQTAFLSSVDLHTHYPYQCLMPESVAIVCSDKYNEIGYFMLTPDHGMSVIGKCRKPGFHPHPSNPPLFEACDHVVTSADHKVDVVDWRNK